MSVDAWALLQAQSAARPKANAALRPMGSGLEKLDGIAMDPSHPDWQSKIQPPADPGPAPVRGAAIVATAPLAGTNSNPSNSRLAIYYGKRDGFYNVAVETAPDWDMDGGVHIVSEQSLREMLPILHNIVKVKDITGEFHVVQKEFQSPERGVSSDRPRPRGPRKKSAKASVGSGDEIAGPSDAPDSLGDNPFRSRLQTGDEAIPGGSLEANVGRENTVLVNTHPLADKKVREELMRQGRESAYKRHEQLKKAHGLDDEDESGVGPAGADGG